MFDKFDNFWQLMTIHTIMQGTWEWSHWLHSHCHSWTLTLFPLLSASTPTSQSSSWLLSTKLQRNQFHHHHHHHHHHHRLSRKGRLHHLDNGFTNTTCSLLSHRLWAWQCESRNNWTFQELGFPMFTFSLFQNSPVSQRQKLCLYHLCPLLPASASLAPVCSRSW